jgi:predicted porin
MKLITAAALAFATLAAAAQTPDSVTVYGLYDAAVRRANNVDANRNSRWTMEDGIITGTRLGLRGRENLGGGLAAVFTIESGFDPSTGLSLQGTPTADYGQVAANPRFWGREAHSLFSSHHIARQDNQLRADLKLAGIDLSATHTFGEQTGSNNGAWAVGLGYSGGSFALAAYVQEMENLAGSEKRRVVGGGGNVRINTTFALFAGVMQRTSAVSPQENLAWTLGANVELGPQVTLSLAHFDDQQDGSTALTGERQVSWVNASYRFSRRTDVYVVIDRNRVAGGYARPAFMGTLGTQTRFATGLRHRF